MYMWGDANLTSNPPDVALVDILSSATTHMETENACSLVYRQPRGTSSILRTKRSFSGENVMVMEMLRSCIFWSSRRRIVADYVVNTQSSMGELTKLATPPLSICSDWKRCGKKYKEATLRLVSTRLWAASFLACDVVRQTHTMMWKTSSGVFQAVYSLVTVVDNASARSPMNYWTAFEWRLWWQHWCFHIPTVLTGLWWERLRHWTRGQWHSTCHVGMRIWRDQEQERERDIVREQARVRERERKIEGTSRNAFLVSSCL